VPGRSLTKTTKGGVISVSCVGLGLLTYWLSGLNQSVLLLLFVHSLDSAIVDAYKTA
jgi:hypothetical protein